MFRLCLHDGLRGKDGGDFDILNTHQSFKSPQIQIPNGQNRMYISLSFSYICYIVRYSHVRISQAPDLLLPIQQPLKSFLPPQLTMDGLFAKLMLFSPS
jgi:hypothetical protein